MLIRKGSREKELFNRTQARDSRVVVEDAAFHGCCVSHCLARSQASKLGLLSKLEKAGLTLKDVEKLLPLGGQNMQLAGSV